MNNVKLLRSLRWIAANARELEFVCPGTSVQTRIEKECEELESDILDEFPKQEDFQYRNEYLAELAKAVGLPRIKFNHLGGVKVPKDLVPHVLEVLWTYRQEFGQLQCRGWEDDDEYQEYTSEMLREEQADGGMDDCWHDFVLL